MLAATLESRPGPDSALELRNQLLSMHAVLVLSLIVSRSRSPKQIIHLTKTAVPAIANCRALGLYHPTIGGTYFERASAELAPQLLGADATGAALSLDGHAWGHAYPLGTNGRQQQPFFVVVGAVEPSNQEKFLLSVLAQTCGTAVSNADFLELERASAATMSDLDIQLETTVTSLRKAMEVHQRLNEVAASQQGEDGIAAALFELTRRPVRIEDRFGNLRAGAGLPAALPGERLWSSKQRQARRDLIAKLRTGRRPVYERGTWFVLAEPRNEVVGLIAFEAAKSENVENELVALEYGATVLSIELARMQSVLETELRMNRDLAEELLTGADEARTKIQAHALGYDLMRPHRVLVFSAPGRKHLDDAFFRMIGRHIKRREIGSLVVARSEGVVVLAHTDCDWEELQAGLAEEAGSTHAYLAIGSRHDHPSEIARSYREAKFVAALRTALAPSNVRPVLQFERLGVYRVLSTVSDLDEVERFMREMLGPLIDYDAKRSADLVTTLTRYLDCGCHYDLTADALHIHRSTLKYRLQRIRELSGQDIGNGEVRFQLQLATKIWQTLRVFSPP